MIPNTIFRTLICCNGYILYFARNWCLCEAFVANIGTILLPSDVRHNCVTGLMYFYSLSNIKWWHIHSILKSPGGPPHADCVPFVSRNADASTRRTARRLAPKFKRLTFQIGIVFHFSTVKRVRPVIARSEIEFVIKKHFLVVTYIFFSLFKQYN